MYMCPECGWTGNKTELEENLSCPDCGSLSVSQAASLDFVPGELDTTTSLSDDEDIVIDDAGPADEISDFE